MTKHNESIDAACLDSFKFFPKQMRVSFPRTAVLMQIYLSNSQAIVEEQETKENHASA